LLYIADLDGEKMSGVGILGEGEFGGVELVLCLNFI